MKSNTYYPPHARIILITGSYGKTNCMELIYRILTQAGCTVACFRHTAELKQIQGQKDFILLCASFPELKHIPVMPDVVVVTNISSYPLYHYQRYRELLIDLYDYFSTLSSDTSLIVNHDYRFLNSIFNEACAFMKVSFFRTNGFLQEGVWLSSEKTIMLSEETRTVPVIRLDDLILQGERNLGIYLAAVAVVYPYVDLPVIQEGCRKFAGHPDHFCCYFLERNIKLYMQLNTGLPSLAEAAFVGFSEKLVIVTGCFGTVTKELSYQGLAMMLSAYAKRLILFGSDCCMIDYAVRKIGVKKAHDLPIIKKETANEAIRYAIESASDGEKILFTPIDYVPGISFDRKRYVFEQITREEIQK